MAKRKPISVWEPFRSARQANPFLTPLALSIVSRANGSCYIGSNYNGLMGISVPNDFSGHVVRPSRHPYSCTDQTPFQGQAYSVVGGAEAPMQYVAMEQPGPGKAPFSSAANQIFDHYHQRPENASAGLPARAGFLTPYELTVPRSNNVVSSQHLASLSNPPIHGIGDQHGMLVGYH